MAKIEVNSSNYEVHRDNESLLLDGTPAQYDMIKLPSGEYHMTVEGKSYTIDILAKDTATGKLAMRINGRVMNTTLQNKLAELLKSMGMESGKRKLKELKAPMPGLVLNVLVEEGQEIAEGQEIMILEAMKMENAIKSPQAGTILSIAVRNQEKVEKNQILIEFS